GSPPNPFLNAGGLWLITISAWTRAASMPESRSIQSRTVFFLGLLLAASGVVSPAIALAGGIAFGFTMEHPFRLESHSLVKLLLQASVVALGFGMNLKQVVH